MKRREFNENFVFFVRVGVGDSFFGWRGSFRVDGFFVKESRKKFEGKCLFAFLGHFGKRNKIYFENVELAGSFVLALLF